MFSFEETASNVVTSLFVVGMLYNFCVMVYAGFHILRTGYIPKRGLYHWAPEKKVSKFWGIGNLVIGMFGIPICILLIYALFA